MRSCLWMVGLVALACALPVEAQTTGAVNGVVVDETNAIPLPGVPVEALTTGAITYTDLDGRYRLDLPAGDHQLKVALGGYAKNLSELADIHPEPFPEDEVVGELLEIRRGVEVAFESAGEIFLTSDQEQAPGLIQQGREIAHRCDVLITRIGKAGYSGELTTALVLATRFYKRIGGHVLNVLSSVVMPLHKVDYDDEKELPGIDDQPE